MLYYKGADGIWWHAIRSDEKDETLWKSHCGVAGVMPATHDTEDLENWTMVANNPKGRNSVMYGM